MRKLGRPVYHITSKPLSIDNGNLAMKLYDKQDNLI